MAYDSVEAIRAHVAGIEAMKGDDESAHSAEAGLHQAVLRVIANGAANPAELAAEALKTEELAFARWCA